MALLLPAGHPQASMAVEAGAGAPLRIGIINVMPKLEAYEPYLLAPFAALPELVEPVFLRLETHGYASSDAAHLERFYRTYAEAGDLDGLVLTGAPVEELAFEDVHYWRELAGILQNARSNVACTLGLCWGGLALGALAGVEKVVFPRKLFGVFAHQPLTPLLGERPFLCAHSRHSGVDARSIENAERRGDVRLLARGEETGHALFETPDERWLAHLGHPEYEGERLAYEWERDRALGRTDVPPPANFDPRDPRTTWLDHRQTVFGTLVRRAGRR